MTRTGNEDECLLSRDELMLVSRTKQPAIKKLSNAELETLATSLRERRDLGQTQKHNLRRLSLLLASLKRLSNELRRRNAGQKNELGTGGETAQALKKDLGGVARDYPESRTASEGMHVIKSDGLLPVERQGERPVLERSRKVR